MPRSTFLYLLFVFPGAMIVTVTIRTGRKQMSFADAVRFLRKCTVNELMLLERVLERRKAERTELRAQKELLKREAIIQLL